ncbi:MAG TPA: LTA synthase family protein [Chitinophagaceae bacterium]|nr:LTA synthase family protein [Chitinophagaceae bacterium]
MTRIQLPRTIRWTLSTGIIFLILMTLFRLGLYLFFGKEPHVLPSFWMGLRFDLRVACIIMLGMLVLGSIISPFKIKIPWLIILTLVTITIVLFYAVDFGHYAYLRQRLNASVLNYLEDAAISMNMVWQSYPVIWIILGLIVLTVMIVWLIKRQFNKRPVAISRAQRNIWFIVFFILFGAGIFGRINQYPLRWSDAFSLGTDYKAQLALNPFESFFNTLRYRHSSYDIEKIKSHYTLLAPYYGLDPAKANELNFSRVISPKQKNDLNVVLVLCESFSGYKSSMWGNPLNTTPYFNKLTQQGVFFDRCFTPAYGTARGVWALITGIPDVELANTASRNPAAVDQHTIINDFTSYDKFYFIGGSASWANIRGLLTNNISNLHLYEQDQFNAPVIDVWGISDKNLLLESNKVLAKQARPFFAVIQTAGNHRPYTIPAEDKNEFKLVNVPKDSLTMHGFESNEELNAFRYTDFCFQKFIEAASKEKYFNNTLFVFIGDHGIPGNAAEMFPDAWTKQRLTSEHVPLLFYAPHLLQPQRIHRIASQIDVLPTIAGLCGIGYTNTALGRDLMDSALYSKQLAFIIDPDNAMAGIVNDSIYYRRQIRSSKPGEVVSITDDHKVPENDLNYYHQLTEGMLETAKYLLLNNKKK